LGPPADIFAVFESERHVARRVTALVDHLESRLSGAATAADD